MELAQPIVGARLAPEEERLDLLAGHAPIQEQFGEQLHVACLQAQPGTGFSRLRTACHGTSSGFAWNSTFSSGASRTSRTTAGAGAGVGSAWAGTGRLRAGGLTCRSRGSCRRYWPGPEWEPWGSAFLSNRCASRCASSASTSALDFPQRLSAARRRSATASALTFGSGRGGSSGGCRDGPCAPPGTRRPSGLRAGCGVRLWARPSRSRRPASRRRRRRH